ncbi:MAG: phosphate acetyltransferase [Calditrichaceae bacterium]|jgi:phosphate acetyltransferase
MTLIEKIRNNAKQNLKTIVLPEGEEIRIIKAAEFLYREKLVTPVLIGNEDYIKRIANENDCSIEGIDIKDPLKSKDTPIFADEYYELRKKKGATPELANETLKNTLYYGAFMVRNNQAAGAVAGSINTTGDVLRAAIQVVGVAPGIKAVSSCFIMVMSDGREYTFGDCAVIPNPEVDQLASIAMSSALTHKGLVGEEPFIAMLSFSTKGSAQHEDVDKVIAATNKVKDLKPDLKIDGELQFDAALIDKIGAKKAPGSPVAGKANVFIFPDLDSGNIGYKIAQRLGNAEAVGPIVQGLKKPYNDLSRGCSVEDVINVACICSVLSE